jgi:hypothetical protein
MTAVLIGAAIGALLIGVPAALGERTRRARRDWVVARAAHRSARETFWQVLGKLVGAALVPVVVVAVLVALSWGRR